MSRERPGGAGMMAPLDRLGMLATRVGLGGGGPPTAVELREITARQPGAHPG